MGTDATAAVTWVEGSRSSRRSTHCTAECVGIHAAKHGDRFEALEPIRQGVRDHFGGLAPAAAAGLALRHDHGSVYLSGDFQADVRFLDMTSSPAFVRQPEGNGCIERFFRTHKEQLLWVRHFSTLQDLRQALLVFKETYKPRVADRATRVSVAGAGVSGVCAHARGVITINALSHPRAVVHPLRRWRGVQAAARHGAVTIVGGVRAGSDLLCGGAAGRRVRVPGVDAAG